MPLITESAFLIIAIIGYGLFFYGLLGRNDNQDRVKIYLLAMLFLLVTAVTGNSTNNQVLGLLSLALAIVAGALASINSAEVLPNA